MIIYKLHKSLFLYQDQSLTYWSHASAGNSGGPAFADLQKAKVAGVAFSKLSNADNVGYIIPYQIIKHFLHVSSFLCLLQLAVGLIADDSVDRKSYAAGLTHLFCSWCGHLSHQLQNSSVRHAAHLLHVPKQGQRFMSGQYDAKHLCLS